MAAFFGELYSLPKTNHLEKIAINANINHLVEYCLGQKTVIIELIDLQSIILYNKFCFFAIHDKFFTFGCLAV